MHPSNLSSTQDGFHRPNRREFLKTALVGTAAAAAATSSLYTASSSAASVRSGAAETIVATLYKSLSEEQRALVTFPFEHPLRSKVDNNWMITEKSIATVFKPDQQAMIREIFLKIHSPEYAADVLKAVEHDSEKEGFGGCAVALFGQPGTGQFEFVLSGRHVTRRCDGDSVAGAAFGGPIFYGHAAGGDTEKADHPGNVYWYQARRANEVFQMLDGRQRALALLGRGRAEEGTKTVALTGQKKELPGIRFSELSRDQREHARKVVADVLAPFRKEDVDESLRLIDAGGWDNLHMAFYKNQDLGGDGVWDVWQIEGPSMLSYFRGAPHVHAWLHIRQPQNA